MNVIPPIDNPTPEQILAIHAEWDAAYQVALDKLAPFKASIPAPYHPGDAFAHIGVRPQGIAELIVYPNNAAPMLITLRNNGTPDAPRWVYLDTKVGTYQLDYDQEGRVHLLATGFGGRAYDSILQALWHANAKAGESAAVKAAYEAERGIVCRVEESGETVYTHADSPHHQVIWVADANVAGIDMVDTSTTERMVIDADDLPRVIALLTTALRRSTQAQTTPAAAPVSAQPTYS
jgi:hypothetical protein